MTITVYTTPSCPQCITTKRFLDRRHAQYVTVDLTENLMSAAYVTQELGYKAAPVVTIHDDKDELVDSWNGFRPDKLAKYTRELV